MKNIKTLGHNETELINIITQDVESISPYAYDLFGPKICKYFYKKAQALLRGDWDQYRLLQTKSSRQRMKRYRAVGATPLLFSLNDSSKTLPKKNKRPAKRRGIG